jgi:hypothetical protein
MKGREKERREEMTVGRTSEIGLMERERETVR